MEAARRDPAGLTRENPHAPLTVSAGVSGVWVGKGRGGLGEQTGAVTPASAPPLLTPAMGRQARHYVRCVRRSTVLPGVVHPSRSSPAGSVKGGLKWAVGLNMCSSVGREGAAADGPWVRGDKQEGC